MKKKGPVQTQVEIHDHFDGSAHCVECQGQCRLPPAELLATGLIRDFCEQWASGYSRPWMMRLKDAGVNLTAFMERAKTTRYAPYLWLTGRKNE